MGYGIYVTNVTWLWDCPTLWYLQTILMVIKSCCKGQHEPMDGMGVPYSQTNPYSLCLSMLGGIPQLVCLKTIVAPIKVGKVNHHYFSGILWFFFLVALL
jgi:hypothetical protein